MNTKQYTPDELEVLPGKREIVATISTDTIDRDREVLKASGMRKKNYAGLPILWGHDGSKFPVGTMLWAKPSSDKRSIVAKYKLHDRTEEARVAFDLMQLGVLKFHSVGFDFERSTYGPPTSKELPHYPHWQGARAVVRDWELLETSIVNIPANPEALAVAVSKGYTPDNFRCLSDSFLPPSDCWEWPEDDVPKQPALITPTFIRPLKSIEARLNAIRFDESEIMARLLGRA